MCRGQSLQPITHGSGIVLSEPPLHPFKAGLDFFPNLFHGLRAEVRPLGTQKVMLAIYEICRICLELTPLPALTFSCDM